MERRILYPGTRVEITESSLLSSPVRGLCRLRNQLKARKDKPTAALTAAMERRYNENPPVPEGWREADVENSEMASSQIRYQKLVSPLENARR